MAADAWAVELLKLRGGALDPERLVGWDSFKEGHLSARRAERPANRVTRTLWAALVVAEQAETPFLARILGEGRPSTSFVGFLATLPPSLASIAEALERRGRRGAADDPVFSDLLALHRHCAEFMAGRGLFEPSWERGEGPRLDRPYYLLAPELVEDWEEWKDRLEGASGFSVLELPRPEPETPLLAYENAWEEYRDVFLRIAALLEEGVAPEDIAVTVADLDAARPWLEEAAAKAGVALVLRRGIDLASSPYGRFLAAIGETAASDFGLPAMKALLLDRFASWKEPDSAAGLVRFGIEHHAFASWSREGRAVDVWEESFRVTGKTGLRSFYRRLRRAVLDIARAPDFPSLRAAVTSFRAQFLDEEGWTPEELRLVERCMGELESLARAEAEYAHGARLPSPFALWTATLATERYVPQRKGALVQAYPWRLSALLPVKYHFLLGCGFDTVAVRYGAEAFLRDDQKEALGRSGRDATEDFLRAYLLSGELVLPCHATEEIGGWSAPHPFFLEGGGEPSPYPIPEATADPLELEKAAWRGEGALPGRLLHSQLRAFEALRTAGTEGGGDFDPLPKSGLDALLPRLESEGMLRLSHSLLAEYRACPFRWLVTRALGLREEKLDLDFFDALLAGEMAHRAIEALFEGMRSLGPIEARHLDEYRRLAEGAPPAILEEFTAEKGPFLEPMFEAWSPLLSDRLRRLVENLVEDGGWEVGELEAQRRLALPSEGILLDGRIDRLARRGEEIAIVDYKKKEIPSARSLVLAEGEEEAEEALALGSELDNTQIASYLSLVEAEGGRVGKASFWSIEEAKELLVIGDEGLRRAGAYGPELRSFRALLGSTASGIRAGRFHWAPPSSPSCKNCGSKAICRSHYSTGN